MERNIAKVVRKFRLGDEPNDFEYWQSRTPQERLDALEEIRKEYNEWKYGPDQRFQRVYRIVKQA